MNNTLINSERVFELFEKICSIPHGSGNMEKISKFCTDFAEKLNLEWYTDDLHNVIIKKPASIGCEDHKTVMAAWFEQIDTNNIDTWYTEEA